MLHAVSQFGVYLVAEADLAYGVLVGREGGLSQCAGSPLRSVA